jgi:NitT/TauT family transport system ATP-binding protein
MSALKVHIRSKRFGAVPVIQDVKFNVAQGEFVCLFGPSGTGKTTILNTIAGIDTDFDGSVEVSDCPRVGYVFQEPRLLPWMTVRQNVTLPIEGRPELLAGVDELLAAVGLADSADQFPERLSLGMARRVAIARAFALKPDLLLMDEPFVSLDAENAERLRALLGVLWASRPTTTVFVTHDLREAVELADRILFFSPRPATLVRDVPILLPHPRTGMDEEIGRMVLEVSG